MTVGELIQQLEKFPSGNEVLVQHGWDPQPSRHYTLDVRTGGQGEPVIMATWRTDRPEDDSEDGRPVGEEFP